MLDLLFGGGDNSASIARENLRRNKELYSLIKDPTYSEYTPELLNSESANYELINDDPVTKSAQLSYLSKLAGLSDTGLSDADNAAFEKARSVGNQVQRQGQQAAIQNAQTRGVGGSGLEFAMREMANQNAAESAQNAGLQQADTSARQRALYNQAYGNALSSMRDQDQRTETANKNIINDFNMQNTRNRQNIYNQNQQQKNQAFMYNEELKDKRYQNQLGRADREAGFNNQEADIGYKENARKSARRGALMGLAGAGIGYYAGGATGAQIGAGLGQSLGSY